MGKFSFSDVARYKYRYDDVSEPLKEYKVGLDGSLTETSTSCSLLGVEKNGKWGWINTSDVFVIPALYDSGFVGCYNGIIELQKNGKWGGIYRDNPSELAFSFRYHYLSSFYRDTYVAFNSNDMCALVKPGDVLLTEYKYKGFSKYNRGNVTEYVRSGFLGREVHGDIDLNTGRELT